VAITLPVIECLVLKLSSKKAVTNLGSTSVKPAIDGSAACSRKYADTLLRMKMTTDNKVFYCADLVVNPQLGRVEVNGTVVRLGPVNMQVLVSLIEQQGRVVSRSALFDRVWENQVVNDETLTRCISELRNRLGQHSAEPMLIETLPKLGYRWVPEINGETPAKDAAAMTVSESESRGWKQVVAVLLAGLIMLLVFSTSFLWLAERYFQPDLVRVALIPTHIDQQVQGSIAADLDDILRDKLLATAHLGFLARSALDTQAQEPFSYYSREFGARWVIEGNIRQKQGKLRVSLSLVDARSAIVVHNLTRDVTNDLSQLDLVCSLFVEEISGILELDPD
jgi:DNA-binding winged helix-turn-helix (wHTH) protein/TolB-like protein